MKFFIKVVNSWKFFTIFAKTSILVVCWVLIATLAHHKISLMTSQTFVVISFVTLPPTPLILMVNVWLWEVFVVYDLFFICSSSQLCCFIGYAVVSSRYRPKSFLHCYDEEHVLVIWTSSPIFVWYCSTLGIFKILKENSKWLP